MKADIFFFTTSIVVVLVGMFLLVGLYYLVQTLRNIRDISSILKKGTYDASDHLDRLTRSVEKSTIYKMFFTAKGKKKSSKKKKSNESKNIKSKE